MRTFFSYLFIALLTFGFVVNEASAKRFGGGRNFGVQRSQNSLFSSNKSHQVGSSAQKATKNRWGGLLGGMLIGGLLTSLFMGHGFANGLMTWLIMGAALFFLISFLRKKMQPVQNSASTHSFAQKPPLNTFTQFGNNSSTSFSQLPNDFDEESFLRNAKVNFIRLQAAYDQKNLQDLQTFTAPEVFAEIKMQLDERGDEPNTTEVIHLNAKLLDISKQAVSTIASIHFTGSIKENDELTNLDEIWHFYQFPNSKEWVVGGIQQEVYQP